MTTLFEHLEEVRAGAKQTLRVRRVPSPEQQAIHDLVRSGARAVVVNATAGSGKTTLLEQLATLLSEENLIEEGESAAFLAYNRPIVKVLRKVLPQRFDVRSLNSLGDLICRQNLPGLKFEPRKYEDLIRQTVLDQNLPSPAVRRELTERLSPCVNLHVGHALSLDLPLDAWVGAMLEVDAPISGAEEVLHTLTTRVLRHGLSRLEQHQDFSFLDQTLAPSVFGWRLAQPYRFLFVDELQDLSAAHLGLILAATDEHSRVVGVGDRNQAIMTFQGADAGSMSRFAEVFGAEHRPLSVSYRLPRRHADLARPFTDAIEAAPGAEEGILDDLSGDDFISMAAPGDLAVCRLNAPLVEWCYQLLTHGIPAIVRGRDLSRSLVALARDAATFDPQRGRPDRGKIHDGLSLEQFDETLNAYALSLTEKYERLAERDGRDPDHQIASLADRVMALQMVHEQSGATTLGELIQGIRQLFTGTPETSVQLSTVHRAKGLEAERVFVLRPELLPLARAKTPQAIEAERCLQFVAYTRATRALYFVDAPETKIPEGLRRS